MRRIVDFNKVRDTKEEINKKCLNILENKKLLDKELNDLQGVDKTPAMKKLIEQYRDAIKEIETISEGIMFYANYMGSVSNQYNGIYDEFKRRIQIIHKEEKSDRI